MAKKNIKEEILNTARRLFNEQGYNLVSMRDIADALSISVGNLTYHYPRKEDLMEAVVLEMHRYYSAPQVPETLPALNAFFAHTQNIIQQNAFYFWHYTQLSQLSPAIHDIQAGMVQTHYTLFITAFSHLRKSGMLQPEAYDGHDRQLAQALQILCVYWVPQSRLLAEVEDVPLDFLDCVWSVLLPALTEEGKRVYQEKIQKVRMRFDAAPR